MMLSTDGHPSNTSLIETNHYTSLRPRLLHHYFPPLQNLCLGTIINLRNFNARWLFIAGSFVVQYFDATDEDAVSPDLHHRWISGRTAAGVWSDISHYLLILSTTERQLPWSQDASGCTVFTNRRLTAVLIDQVGRPGWVLHQPKKQTWEDFLVTFGTKVSCLFQFLALQEDTGCNLE